MGGKPLVIEGVRGMRLAEAVRGRYGRMHA